MLCLSCIASGAKFSFAAVYNLGQLDQQIIIHLAGESDNQK